MTTEDGNVSDEFATKLEELECPFSWSMDDIGSKESTDLPDDEDLVPLLRLMQAIMTVFFITKDNEDAVVILQRLDDCDKIMSQIRREQDPQFSTEAIQYILDSTRCHVLHKLKETDSARKLFEELENKKPKLTSALDKSTIIGCRGICWSTLRSSNEKAIESMETAMEDNPDCDLWNFIYAKNLRRIRREGHPSSLPDDAEVDAFLKAYSRSKNPTYGIFAAQMYREARNTDKALAMYKDIFQARPKSNSVYQRLALGFMQLHKLGLAKHCLDIVGKTSDSTRYNHYLGKYYVKVRNLTKAQYHLKKSSDENNYRATKDYIKCMLKLNRHYDPTTYLLNIYENRKNKNNQCVLIDIALCYLNKKEYDSSVEYFVLAIESNPFSNPVTQFFSFFDPGQIVNIYDILKQQVFPFKCRLKEKSLINLEKLEKYYQEYIDKEMNSMKNLFKKL